MGLSLVIAAGIVISGFAVTWLGVELTFYPPQSAVAKRKVRITLGISFLALLGFTLWGTMRGEKAMADLPKQVADYLKGAVPQGVVPSQPEGSSTPREKAIDGKDHRKGEKMNPPARATVEIGLTLGADKGIGKDSIADCKSTLYRCLKESEIRGKTLVLDVGSKRWARIIFEIKNTSHVKVPRGSLTHIESPDAISLDFAPAPNPQRLPRNILDLPGNYDLQPFNIAKGNYAVPVDVVVPQGIDRFALNVKVFGDNLPAHELHISFLVNGAD